MEDYITHQNDLVPGNNIEMLPVTISDPTHIQFLQDQEYVHERFKEACLFAFRIPEELFGLGEKNITFRTGSVNDNYGRYARAINSLR